MWYAAFFSQAPDWLPLCSEHKVNRIKWSNNNCMGNDPFERVWEMNYLSSGDEEHKCDSTMTWNEVWKYYNLIYLLLVEEKNKRTPLHLSYSPTVEPLICQRQFSWSLSSPQISMIPLFDGGLYEQRFPFICVIVLSIVVSWLC